MSARQQALAGRPPRTGAWPAPPAHPVGHHGGGQLVGDAGAPAVPAPKITIRWSGSGIPVALAAASTAARLTAPGALDVVVESQPLVPVPLEQPPGVADPEVLPVQQGQREQLADRA